MRDVSRRLRVGLWVAVAVGVAVTLSPRIHLENFAGSPAAGTASGRTEGRGLSPAALASLARRRAGESQSIEAERAGVLLPSASAGVPVAKLTSAVRAEDAVRPLRALLPADLLVVAPRSLPHGVTAAIRRLHGVTAARLIDAARVQVNGGYVSVLGVDPSSFRAFAAAPTARSNGLWQSVADGDIAVSYLMGKQEKLPLGGTVLVAGAHTERLRVGGFGTVGISGVDAVVSAAVARSLGMPAGNAIVISAPHARLNVLMGQLKRLLPANASIAPLVAQGAAYGPAVSTGVAGATGVTGSDGPGLTAAQRAAFLTAAESRIGDPYIWGAAGPGAFDCSGLVQWAMRQAGIVMPRVAVDQALTGPQVALNQLEPGDLLFYHTDPTAPSYISHVAIYIGDGLMLQAPEPGLDVEIVPAILGGPGFAGAVSVYPKIAAMVAVSFAS